MNGYILFERDTRDEEAEVIGRTSNCLNSIILPAVLVDVLGMFLYTDLSRVGSPELCRLKRERTIIQITKSHQFSLIMRRKERKKH